MVIGDRKQALLDLTRPFHSIVAIPRSTWLAPDIPWRSELCRRGFGERIRSGSSDLITRPP